MQRQACAPACRCFVALFCSTLRWDGRARPPLAPLARLPCFALRCSSQHRNSRARERTFRLSSSPTLALACSILARHFSSSTSDERRLELLRCGAAGGHWGSLGELGRVLHLGKFGAEIDLEKALECYCGLRRFDRSIIPGRARGGAQRRACTPAALQFLTWREIFALPRSVLLCSALLCSALLCFPLLCSASATHAQLAQMCARYHASASRKAASWALQSRCERRKSQP